MKDRSRVYDLVFALSALAATATLPACARDADDPMLAALLRRGIERGYPGIAVLIDSTSGGRRPAAAGFSDLEARTPMRIEDEFHMASINKTITAAATLQLVDRGTLTLTDTLSTLLGSAVAGIPGAHRITVAQLLDHSSGIYATNNDPEYLATLIGTNADPRRVWSPAELVALADGSRQEPLAGPGQEHHYSDTNYVILGMIVEKVSGQPYKHHVESSLFEPLGMRSTWFYSGALAAGAKLPAGSTRGYLLATEELREVVHISPIFPAVAGAGRADAPLLDTTLAAERVDAAGGLVTTLPDLMKFAAALFRGSLLSPGSQAFLTASAKGMEAEPVGTARVWALQSIRQPWGVALYKKGDSPGGFNTLMAYHVASDTILVGFINCFGYFDEVDFLFEVFGQLLEAEGNAGRGGG